MCHLNLIFNRNKEKSHDISSCMNVLSYLSWKANDDGEGMLGFRTKNIAIKRSMTKMVYKQAYYLLATHQRVGTSGKKDLSSCHPFETEHFVLMHNGIFSGLGNGEKSDTAMYSEILEQNFAETGDLIPALNKTHASVGGYYSVIIYIKGTGKVYYYRNEQARIYGFMSPEWLCLSTSKENIDYAKTYFKVTGQDLNIEPLGVYEITDAFRRIGTIKQVSYVRFSKPETAPIKEVEFDEWSTYSRYGKFKGYSF